MSDKIQTVPVEKLTQDEAETELAAWLRKFARMTHVIMVKMLH